MLLTSITTQQGQISFLHKQACKLKMPSKIPLPHRPCITSLVLMKTAKASVVEEVVLKMNG